MLENRDVVKTQNHHPKLMSITGDIDDGILEDRNCMGKYLEVLDKYGAIGTFPVTATAVVDFPERIEYILKKGHQIEGHGDVHKGFYGSVEEQTARLKSMNKTIFDYTGIKINGFRAPWGKYDENLFFALYKAGLKFDSSKGHVPNMSFFNLFGRYYYADTKFRPLLNPFNKFIHIIKKKRHEPYFHESGILEIPVLSYDDWFLIDYIHGPKYTSKESENIGKIWFEQLSNSNVNTLVIEAHPGRMTPEYLPGLDILLRLANKSCKFVSLAEICDEIHGFHDV